MNVLDNLDAFEAAVAKSSLLSMPRAAGIPSRTSRPARHLGAAGRFFVSDVVYAASKSGFLDRAEAAG